MADGPNGWNDEYRSALGAYETCAHKLETLLRDLLKEADIDIVDVESRAKDPDSFQRKVEGKKDAYPDPLDDVTDLIGVRIIAYYLEDVDGICDLLKREFAVDDDHSGDKLEDLEPDRFGYRSVHFVVSLSDARRDLTEWRVFEGKRAEIQLRTATQHAWAAVEHKLSYKRTREAPRDLRRRLHRLSALFELADEQFSAVRTRLEEVETQYSDDVRGGNLELPVDKASLEAFVDGNDLVERLVKKGRDAGLEIASPDSEEYETRLDVDLRDLVVTLDSLGIATIAELDAILRTESIVAAVDAISSAPQFDRFRWRSPVDLLTILVLYQQEARIELVQSIYHASTVEAFEAMRAEKNQ